MFKKPLEMLDITGIKLIEVTVFHHFKKPVCSHVSFILVYLSPRSRFLRNSLKLYSKAMRFTYRKGVLQLSTERVWMSLLDD